MLFDLRARGRRRTVKVVYTGLALLMGLALVFLGLGGLGGNVFESLSKEGTSGGGYGAKITAAKKQIAKNPSNAAAWIALAEAQLHEADGGEFYESATETYTASGRAELRKASNSWSKYLALNPNPPSVRLAKEMANIFSAGALNEPANAVAALQIVIAAEPESASLYSQLAEYAFLAHNERQGDLAMKKAVALVPKAKRPLLEAELEKVKRSANEKAKSSTSTTAAAGAVGAAAGTTGGTAGTTTSPTVTASSTSAAGKKK
jgi:hypothetical protein